MSRGGLDAGAGPVADQRQDHRVHVLHVDGAAAPDVAVALLAGERVHAPLGGVGGDDVQVPVHQQRGAAAVGRPRCGRPGWPGRARTRRSGDSMPTSASLQATHSAAARSPALVAVSPVFVVSIRMRSDSSSATSPWAAARGAAVGSAMAPIVPPRRGPPDRVTSLAPAHPRADIPTMRMLPELRARDPHAAARSAVLTLALFAGVVDRPDQVPAGVGELRGRTSPAG